MRISYFLFLLTAISFSTFSACGDDDSVSIESKVTVDGVDYELTRAFVETVNEPTTGQFELLVWLTSEGISINNDGDFIGQGDLMLLGFISSAEDALPNGSYTIADGTLLSGAFLAGADFSATVNIDASHAILASSAEVAGSSEKEINFSFTGPGSSTGNLDFKGSIRILE